MKKIKVELFVGILGMIFISCNNPLSVISKHEYPPIYPDYTNVAIPVNIAPLNFLLRDSSERIIVTIQGEKKSITVKGKNKIHIPVKKWKTFLMKEQGNKINVSVEVLFKGKWIKYQSFYWDIKKEYVDPFLSYRLIEPGYEVWNKLQLVERNIESFDERVIADNNLTGGSCMNCHIHSNHNDLVSMFHLRGEKGGTILNRNGKLRKIETKTNGMLSNAVYGNFHPFGRYAVFSTNIIIPAFHSYRSKRLEVYDTKSDLVVLDFDNNEVITQPFLSDTNTLETFPVFSADGKWIYYCVANAVPLPGSIENLRYSICRVGFNSEENKIATKVDTLWDASKMNGSVSHLKTSPDGKYLLYTVADYGTFPIWHREADLQLMNLETGQIDNLENVNGFCSDSYHSWSSNSRWFVFASKRDDGIYGKPYFCYIDSTGKTYKPFVLPQRNPTLYDNILKSYNIPELSNKSVPFNASDIEHIYWQEDAEQVSFIN